MTVPVATRKAGPYTGNGVATSFAFSFKTFAKADLLLIRTVIATGIESTLVLDSDYSVALNPTQDVTPGGTITYPLVGSPMASTHSLTVASDLEIKQPLDITNLGGFFPQTQEDAFDRTVMLIGQLEVDVARAVKVNLSSTIDPDDLIADLAADAAAAAASAVASAASASAASGSASTATTQASNAAVSALAAQNIVDSVGFRDVLFKTFADSPITITQAMSGKLLSIDTSGGNVAVTMPQISTLVLPFTVGVKKTTGDANTAIATRSGTDTFDDGSTTLTFASVSGAALIPDTDSAPDKWSVASFGTSTGQQLKQQFSAGVGFTAGVSTTVTLTETPLAPSKDALEVFQDGVYQQESEWSYAAGSGVITFGSVIGASVAKIEAVWATPLAIGVPADGTVTPLKLATAALGPFVGMLNGTIVTSRAGNAETIAIKTSAGADPSAADPVFLIFRNATASNGTYVVRQLTAAFSQVISSGSTLGATNATPFPVWFGAFDDAGTIRPAVVNTLSGTSIMPLRDDILASATSEGGAGAADSAQVIYSNAAVTTKPFRMLAKLEYTLAAVGTWGTAPSKVQLFGPGVSLPGGVIQEQVTQTGVVQTTGGTAIPLDDTIPQNTEGDQIYTQALTPTSATNVLAVEINTTMSGSSAGRHTMALYQDSIANALAAVTQANSVADVMHQMFLKTRLLAGATAATTFKVRVGGNISAVITINGASAARLYGGVALSVLSVQEIMT